MVAGHYHPTDIHAGVEKEKRKKNNSKRPRKNKKKNKDKEKWLCYNYKKIKKTPKRIKEARKNNK